MKKRGIICEITYLFSILFLVIVTVYSGLRVLESTIFSNQDTVEPTVVSKTVTSDGVDYFPRQDIQTLLVSGIDQVGPMASSQSFNNAGAVDMISLVIFDETNQNIRILTLNRDTMVDDPVLAINGQVARTRFEQLALSHSYGSGLEDSCENVKRAVSGLLNGIQIDHYITINMDAIQILNDAVGGVTVDVTDDFSAVDPTLTMGEITLHGEQAIHYVRSRHSVGDQLNTSRMERHKAYMAGFMEALLRSSAQSDSFIFKTYDKLSDYMVSDCSATVLSSMMERYGNFTVEEIVSPSGENRIGTSPFGEQHYEFYPDKTALNELTLRLFYKPKV